MAIFHRLYFLIIVTYVYEMHAIIRLWYNIRLRCFIREGQPAAKSVLNAFLDNSD